MRALYICEKCGGLYLNNRCDECGIELSKMQEPQMLCEGIFEDYDNIVFMTGLNVDKKLLNNVIHSISREDLGNALILTSNVSDAQVLALLFHRRNYGKFSPFYKKEVYHLYGDGPYTHNKFVNYVYVRVPYEDLASRLRLYVDALWANGVWGWELLSYFFKEYMRYMNIGNDQNINCSVKVKGKDEEKRKNRLEFLARMAGPSSLCINEGGELAISDSLNDIADCDEGKVVAVPVKRFLPAFDFELIKSQLSDIEAGKTAFVTLGGAEHNIYLDLAVAERRESLDDKSRVLYDNSNVFDRMIVKKSPEDKVELITHGYVGVEMYDAEENSVVFITRDGPTTAGVIVKIKHIFKDFYQKSADLFVIFGTGGMGALATKLTFIRMLLKDSCSKLKDYGIYYVMLTKDGRRFNVYKQVDPVHEAVLIAPLLFKENIGKISRITSVP